MQVFPISRQAVPKNPKTLQRAQSSFFSPSSLSFLAPAPGDLDLEAFSFLPLLELELELASDSFGFSGTAFLPRKHLIMHIPNRIPNMQRLGKTYHLKKNRLSLPGINFLS